jgi:hypothetical protein
LVLLPHDAAITVEEVVRLGIVSTMNNALDSPGITTTLSGTDATRLFSLVRRTSAPFDGAGLLIFTMTVIELPADTSTESALKDFTFFPALASSEAPRATIARMEERAEKR